MAGVPPPDCPSCGRAMTLRTARRGAHAGDAFWGCAHYPYCTASRDATTLEVTSLHDPVKARERIEGRRSGGTSHAWNDDDAGRPLGPGPYSIDGS